MNGFVHIIESPSSSDLLHGRTEGQALSQALVLAQIPHWYNLVTDIDTLGQALGPRLIEAWRSLGRLPILHFSMHGNQEGVALTNGEFILWHSLRQALLPLNRVTNGGLLICMSSCFGSSGCRMAMYSDNEPSFWALVGNAQSSTWADAAVAYITFYHLFFKSFPIETCVESMKVASADHKFLLQSGPATRAGWLNFVQRAGGPTLEQAASEAQERVEHGS